MKKLAKHQLVNIATLCPSAILDIRYATPNNFLNMAVYPSALCFVHKNAAQALQNIVKDLAKLSLKLKIFDGYRPLSVQQKMWEALPDERFVANPAKTGGRHTRGTAVDVTLTDVSGIELEMPTPFDSFSEKASSSYSNLSEKVLQNRTLLKEVMLKYDFEQLPSEWWHFDLKGWKDDFKYPPLNYALNEL